VHSEEQQHVVSESSGHSATPREQPNDIQTHAPCGTGVARKRTDSPVPELLELSLELRKIVSQWPSLPEHIRAAIMTLIGASSK